MVVALQDRTLSDTHMKQLVFQLAIQLDTADCNFPGRGRLKCSQTTRAHDEAVAARTNTDNTEREEGENPLTEKKDALCEVAYIDVHSM